MKQWLLDFLNTLLEEAANLAIMIVTTGAVVFILWVGADSIVEPIVGRNDHAAWDVVRELLGGNFRILLGVAISPAIGIRYIRWKRILSDKSIVPGPEKSDALSKTPLVMEDEKGIHS